MTLIRAVIATGYSIREREREREREIEREREREREREIKKIKTVFVC